MTICPADLMQNHIDVAVECCQAYSVQIVRRRRVARLLDRLLETLLFIGREDAHHRRIEKLIRRCPDQLKGVGAGVRDAAIVQIGGNQGSMSLNSAG